ncbi:leucine-rich repeat protein [Akkermansiaceae bacterium]|nr:leucine-rich repeat protein [Akkermansiaceae bacterium]MDB4626046.1 leucine-rich repeat protein [Akkermansiaceae bacterium]
MKHLISLLAFSFLIGCDGEKSNVAPSKDSPEKAASETKPPKAISVSPNLKYEVEGDAVTITGCDKKVSGELIIAAMIEGKPVTSIGESAFASCENLTSIEIPNSVERIGQSTFFYCTSLTNITVPDGVTSIGYQAFYKCTSLTSITIPDSVTSIGYGAFRNCTSLTAVTFLEDAPKIEDDAFEKSSPTIYREADAKGWSDTLAGRPVKLITEKP